MSGSSWRARPNLARIAMGAAICAAGCAFAAFALSHTPWFRAWVVTMERRIARNADLEIERSPTMVWAHRGLRGPLAEPNTAAAMRAAADAGFAGVEMDLRCRDGSLWVAHDADEAGARFSEVIAGVGPAQYVWLDFKQLSLETARECAPALRRELPAALHTRAFVESKSLPALDHLRAAIPGLRVIYTTSRWHWQRFSFGYASLLRDMERHDISNLGIPQRALTPELARALRAIGIFTWTTNDAAGIDRQWTLEVDVILTDLPVSAAHPR